MSVAGTVSIEQGGKRRGGVEESAGGSAGGGGPLCVYSHVSFLSCGSWCIMRGC